MIKGLFQLAKILYKFGAKTDIPDISKVIESANYQQYKEPTSEQLAEIFGSEEEDENYVSSERPKTYFAQCNHNILAETIINAADNSTNNHNQANHYSFKSTYLNSKENIAIFGFSFSNFVSEANSAIDFCTINKYCNFKY